jgi:hypothetical protein
MGWRLLPIPNELHTDLKRKARILVDESLDDEVVKYLRDNGYNAVSVKDVGLLGSKR